MKVGLFFLAIVSLYFVTKIATEIRQYSLLGAGVPASNTISFNGTGEVFAVSDIAEITYTVRHTEKTVQAAKDKVSVSSKKALEFLKSSGVEEKDIKTISYNSYPKYDYQSGPEIACMALNCPRPGKQVLIGYDVSETVTVKVRNTDNAGKIIDGITNLGISELSGPNFAIDDEEKLKTEARAKAIADAKVKADLLSRQLGVKLVRIVNFTESGNYPMYFKTEAANAGGAAMDSAAVPALSKGEQKITSNVTITYEIR